MEPFESLRLCDAACAGIMGILLLVGNAGRPWVACAATFATVSVRFKLANFEGGNGLEPDGRANLLDRKSSR